MSEGKSVCCCSELSQGGVKSLESQKGLRHKGFSNGDNCTHFFGNLSLKGTLMQIIVYCAYFLTNCCRKWACWPDCHFWKVAKLGRHTVSQFWHRKGKRGGFTYCLTIWQRGAYWHHNTSVPKSPIWCLCWFRPCGLWIPTEYDLLNFNTHQTVQWPCVPCRLEHCH